MGIDRNKQKINLQVFKITNSEALNAAEKEHRNSFTGDFMPYANNTPYVELAESVIPDKNGDWVTPLALIISQHNPQIGVTSLCESVYKFFREKNEQTPLDILSINATMGESKIILKSLIRTYNSSFDYTSFFNIVGDPLVENIYEDEEYSSGNLIVPEEITNFSYTDTEIALHDTLYKEQMNVFKNSSKEKPFLNSIEKYVPKKLPKPEEKIDLIYDLKTNDMKQKTIAPYEEFTKVFREIMIFVNGVEYYSYVSVIQGEKSEESFMAYLEDYIINNYVNKSKLDKEDVPVMMKKLRRSLFQLYVVQDLIDDPDVTDIKITGPDSIRARVNGKAYISNITFIDASDYRRFVNAVCIRNRVSQFVPEQTFTDDRDENYILRFSLTAEYVNSVEWPYLHIRKINRQKLMADDLIKAGMMDEKLRDYLLDCGKNSRGVVFAGPPGSGKTICLNWFLEEAYEQSAEILVIQENDELFCYRKGVMFQHVVNYPRENEMPVSLEELGQLALVAGANVFIIGEAKGAEICSAITLSNSGCRTAITVHSPSSTETIDKMADLAMRGYAKDIDQAKRMLRSFQTIVYLENFKIKEISEIVGYNEETHDMEYNYIYRREED